VFVFDHHHPIIFVYADEITMTRPRRRSRPKPTAKPKVTLPATIADDQMLQRDQAAAFITERLGVRISTTKLAILASDGGGPVFRRFGSRVYYRVADLRSWVTAKLGETYTSTADYHQKRRRAT
jgi:hypothetical protein